MPYFAQRTTWLLLATCMCCGGCMESRNAGHSNPFDEQDLDAVLAIVVDMSGSYSTTFDDKAYQLFLDISDRFFQGAMGTETRLILGQLSGSDQVLLFEGRPSDLRKKFRSPQELSEFLRANADPTSSRVYEATHRTLDYVSTVSGVGPDTRILTVILSDMQDSSVFLNNGNTAEQQLKDALSRYQAHGGALALYYVAESERGRWHSLLQEAGFATGRCIIESDLTSSPQLPRFE